MLLLGISSFALVGGTGCCREVVAVVVVHAWHIWWWLHVLLLLLQILLLLHLVSLWVLLVLVLATGLVFSIQDHKLLGKLLVLHAQLLTNLNKSAQTVDIIRVLLVDILIHFKCFVEQVHATVARSNHEGPLVLLGLDLLCALEIDDGLFEHVVLSVVHTQA